MKSPVIVVDFDGTVVEHEYPEVGATTPHSVRVLRRLVSSGCRLVLFTMRSGKYLDDAVKWFDGFDIPLWGVNVNPEQHTWTMSPKAYGNVYIDDAAIGCPLLPSATGGRPYVDWAAVEVMLEKKSILGPVAPKGKGPVL